MDAELIEAMIAIIGLYGVLFAFDPHLLKEFFRDE